MSQYCTSIVGLYAGALFDYGFANNQLEILAKEASQFVEFLEQDELLVESLAAPIYSEAEQSALLKKISQALGLVPAISNLLLLLVKNKRIILLSKILAEFVKKVDKHSGYRVAKVTVAYKLSNVEQKIVKEKLEEFLLSKIHVNFVVDPEIIGGIVIKIDDEMFDSSVRNKFALLTRAVKKKLALISNGV